MSFESLVNRVMKYVRSILLGCDPDALGYKYHPSFKYALNVDLCCNLDAIKDHKKNSFYSKLSAIKKVYLLFLRVKKTNMLRK